MSVKVTALDISIARNLKRFREEAKLSQPHVAGYLGVTYQSYQKMEGGRVSFRASAIERLCDLYGVSYDALVSDDDRVHVNPHGAALVAMVRDFDDDQQRELHDHAVKLKYKESAHG
jgi:transcriptional regulator with XRE-family HTH domain